MSSALRLNLNQIDSNGRSTVGETCTLIKIDVDDTEGALALIFL